MSHLSKSSAALRIAGDDLVPEEVTALLGREPTTRYRKGDVVRGENTARIYTKKFGMWALEIADRSPGDLEAQILELLNSLTNDLGVWSRLKSGFEIDLYCGFFMKASNEGTTISNSVLRLLGERGIELSIEIYAAINDET